MKWKPNKITAPKLDDERVIRKFLIIPRHLDGEWRWMEFANIKQKFEKVRTGMPDCKEGFVWTVGWQNIHWEDSEESDRDEEVKVPPAPPPPPPRKRKKKKE